MKHLILAIAITCMSIEANASETQLNKSLACQAQFDLEMYASLYVLTGQTIYKQTAYEQGEVLLEDKNGVDRIFAYLDKNKDSAGYFADAAQLNDSPAKRQFVQSCNYQPDKYIPSYKRLVKQGILPNF